MFEVCEKKCDQCLFTDKRVVSAARMKQILQECARTDTHFTCHKGSAVGKDLCCRGFYDSGLGSNGIRVSQRMGWIRFVPIPTLEQDVKVRSRRRQSQAEKAASNEAEAS